MGIHGSHFATNVEIRLSHAARGGRSKALLISNTFISSADREECGSWTSSSGTESSWDRSSPPRYLDRPRNPAEVGLAWVHERGVKVCPGDTEGTPCGLCLPNCATKAACTNSVVSRGVDPRYRGCSGRGSGPLLWLAAGSPSTAMALARGGSRFPPLGVSH